MFVVAILSLLALAPGAFSHMILKDITVDGKTYVGWFDGSASPSTADHESIARKIQDEHPIAYNAPNIATAEGEKAKTLDPASPVLTADATAGGEVSVTLNQWPGDGNQDHQGPITVYMADCGESCVGKDGMRLEWFKTHEWGYDASTQTWPTKILKSQGDSWTWNLPKDIPSSNYLIRFEIIALQSQAMIQYYPRAFQINLSGGGNTKPSPTGQFPGIFTDNTSRNTGNVEYQIWSHGGSGDDYTVPGLDVYQNGVSENPGPGATGGGGSSGSSGSSSTGSTTPSSNDAVSGETGSGSDSTSGTGTNTGTGTGSSSGSDTVSGSSSSSSNTGSDTTGPSTGSGSADSGAVVPSAGGDAAAGTAVAGSAPQSTTSAPSGSGTDGSSGSDAPAAGGNDMAGMDHGTHGDTGAAGSTGDNMAGMNDGAPSVATSVGSAPAHDGAPSVATSVGSAPAQTSAAGSPGGAVSKEATGSASGSADVVSGADVVGTINNSVYEECGVAWSGCIAGEGMNKEACDATLNSCRAGAGAAVAKRGLRSRFSRAIAQL